MACEKLKAKLADLQNQLRSMKQGPSKTPTSSIVKKIEDTSTALQFCLAKNKEKGFGKASGTKSVTKKEFEKVTRKPTSY